MQLLSIKEFRALALLATSFGFELAKQQIVFAKELSDLLVYDPVRPVPSSATPPLGRPADHASSAVVAPVDESAAPQAPVLRSEQAAEKRAAIRFVAVESFYDAQPARPSDGQPGSRPGEYAKPTAAWASRSVAAVAMRDTRAWTVVNTSASAHDRVEKHAYELWENEGHPEGQQLRHWLQAEREMLDEHRRAEHGDVLHPAA